VDVACWRPGFGHGGMVASHRTLVTINYVRSRGDRLAGILIARQRMLPRQVLPRQFYLITRRCVQRQFLPRPDAATNNAFLYCLIHASLRCEIDVLLPCAMSNHYHAVISDRGGRYPEFIEHFHKLLARSQNALRGRWENLWSSEQTCVVKLVDRVHHWPGGVPASPPPRRPRRRQTLRVSARRTEGAELVSDRIHPPTDRRRCTRPCSPAPPFCSLRQSETQLTVLTFCDSAVAPPLRSAFRSRGAPAR
jgi:hypothetical protein